MSRLFSLSLSLSRHRSVPLHTEQRHVGHEKNPAAEVMDCSNTRLSDRGGHCLEVARYRGTSLIRYKAPLELYSRTMPMTLWWSYGGGLLLMRVITRWTEHAGGTMSDALRDGGDDPTKRACA